ncbi:Leucine-rich repeat-containing protein sog2 [Cytospora mali]|uniref:Leucine-rich repeat-containing protein sog2 n=1 Tax=Cytospora mali TaxID=578113 RepID=A0A194WB17_CYTMA|nr:Leucine-rich repeat-containing protein sog2 [Valsa mali]
MERPSGLNPGQAGLPGNPAQGRRPGVAAGVNIPPPPPIPKNVRKMPSSSGLTASAPIAASQVVVLAKEAMKKALEENESQAGEASVVSSEIKAGVTVNLSHKNIQKLPEEVVDIIKDQLERLALSHNKISSFPARFSECSLLRYLNVRSNRISEFPLSLCDLKSLEILDLGRNQLKVLPPDIAKLTSLKVLAVQKNFIKELPLCLADMGSLQMIKLDGNPIIFPPRDVLQAQASSPPNEGFLKETEVKELTVTTSIKKFLRQHAQHDRMEAEAAAAAAAGGEDSSEGVETPRLPPSKRVASGRFPIKVNGTDLPDLRSPNNAARPPPIPTRSHYRGLSQQNTAIRRPGTMPLTIGNVNERVRSNSETLLQPRSQYPVDRQRRMASVSKRAQELGTLDETQANNLFSHYRGLSHGSAMQGTNGNGLAVKSPASPAEPFLQRPIYVRRLSVLPERKRESKYIDPVLEAAKGILYSVFQIHPMIQMLMHLTSDGTSKRSSLEIVFYNTNVHVEQLEQEIQRHEAAIETEESGPKENESVQRACITLVNAYAHVCSLLATNVDMFIDNGDPRYIRTLLMLLYNSIMELRVTVSNPSPDAGFRRAANRAAMGDTIRPHPHSRESSVTPTADRPGHGFRSRSGNFVHNPSNLRVATDVPLNPMPIPYVNGTGRAAAITPTPRSGESWTSNSSRGLNGDFTEEDRFFERIFLSLQRSTNWVMRTLPSLNSQFGACLDNAMVHGAPKVMQHWRILIGKCSTAIHNTEMLKKRLSIIKLKEPGIRTHGGFWALCNNFIDAWAELGKMVKDIATGVPEVQLPHDTRQRLRPIQHSVQETCALIQASPWADALRGHSYPNSASSSFGGSSSQNQVLPIQTNLPMTPQSAALGPAVQATVATPQSASFANAFNGGVFERADALISMGGRSMGSRNGTMSSASGHSSLSSINSTASSNDDLMTPGPLAHPGPPPYGAPLPIRLNHDRRVAL